MRHAQARQKCICKKIFFISFHYFSLCQRSILCRLFCICIGFYLSNLIPCSQSHIALIECVFRVFLCCCLFPSFVRSFCFVFWVAFERNQQIFCSRLSFCPFHKCFTLCACVRRTSTLRLCW